MNIMQYESKVWSTADSLTKRERGQVSTFDISTLSVKC